MKILPDETEGPPAILIRKTELTERKQAEKFLSEIHLAVETLWPESDEEDEKKEEPDLPRAAPVSGQKKT